MKYSHVKKLLRQLPVIAALLPSLVLNEIASVQALDRRQGAVFYLDVQYGSDKGRIARNDTMLSALTGHARDRVTQRQYASTLVEGENTGLDGSADATYSVRYRPGVDVTSSRRSHPERTVALRNSAGVFIASDNNAHTGNTEEHTGILRTHVGNNVVGTISAAGVFTITNHANLSTESDGYLISYMYQYDLPVNETDGMEISRIGVPEANIAMAQSTVTAMDFPIRSRYSLGAAVDVQRAHGIKRMVPLYSNVYRKAA